MRSTSPLARKRRRSSPEKAHRSSSGPITKAKRISSLLNSSCAAILSPRVRRFSSTEITPCRSRRERSLPPSLSPASTSFTAGPAPARSLRTTRSRSNQRWRRILAQALSIWTCGSSSPPRAISAKTQPRPAAIRRSTVLTRSHGANTLTPLKTPFPNTAM